jgi:hypothetical protein
MTPARKYRKVAPSPSDLEALVARWKELQYAPREDADAQAELKQVRDRIREVAACPHGDCPLVELDVPQHTASTDTQPVYFAIANAAGRKEYTGHVIAPRCIAHEIMRMIAQDRWTDARRMTARETKLTETSRISEIARQIAAS